MNDERSAKCLAQSRLLLPFPLSMSLDEVIFGTLTNESKVKLSVGGI